MDVASPLLEYVNSGRMMSMDEISEIIQVVRSADKYKADADRLADALAVMIHKAQKQNWNDAYPEQLDTARSALAAHEAGS